MRAFLRSKIVELTGVKPVIWANQNAPRPKLPLYQKNIENSVSFQDSDTSSDIAFGVLFQDDNRSSDGPVNIVKKSEEDK